MSQLKNLRSRLTFRGRLTFGGQLSAIAHRKPVKRRHPWGYVATILLAGLGFAAGLAVHSWYVGVGVAVVFLLLGLAANEVWATELHTHDDHYPNL